MGPPTISIEVIRQRIFVVRGLRVMLSGDLAELYGVEPKALSQAIKRNRARFPSDFAFQLEAGEWVSLRSQIVTLDAGRGRFAKYPPHAFTEQGVAMLSSVLRSARAVEVNIEIMRTFVQLRRWALSHTQLTQRIAGLERKYDGQFKVVFEALRELMEAPVPLPRRRIGFRGTKEGSAIVRRRH